ncbi:ABC transporter permease [Ancylobacter pratisalsi]|uniref:ABC transporter permease subunit n=1 Tax=Ancylobacter pratisalsi TaxID=1745854 RepID=A0A6P1YQA3_9HYPH|nr:ABC transporter permease subunit [Ancylobacter pratisalsi]QIB35225.1 ABC transporter permease subunit [Ancylobacter pratisalsi]
MRRPGLTAAMLWPALIIMAPLLLGPLFALAQESLKPYVGGRIGGDDAGALTLDNYALIAAPEYVRYFLDTFRVGLISSGLALALGFPMAHFIVRRARPATRRVLIGGLVGTLFLSLIVRVYAISMTFGPLGPLSGFSRLFGIRSNSPDGAELMVVLGLMNTTLPLVALTLIGTLQNINPRLEEAAMSLGAPRWKTFFLVTVAMSVPGILSAGIIAYAFCISNLVVPMLVGRGFILFVSNLIYSRFSDVANFPGGAALSIVMMVISVSLFYGLLHLVRSNWQEAGK